MTIEEAQKAIDANQHLREYIRRRANEYGKGRQLPIRVVSGNKRPQLEGEGFHYETPAGRRIHHINAYSKVAFDAVYHASTLRIEVGLLWLQTHRPGTFR